MRRLLTLTLVLALLIGGTALANREGKKAPPLNLKAVFNSEAYKKFKPKDAKDRVILLDFWQTS